ncbi:MAG: squalene/phytoene synthase family protein [Elusimicrobiaceae bacterium]|nr:squalene/phytoene synthase family protein [Elusimicrobiaceae bacterium]
MNQPQTYKKSSFGPAFFFLKKRKRRALADYYAFCRLADDIADEPSRTNPQEELKSLAQEIDFIYAGVPKTDLGQVLRQDVQDFQISKDRFTLLLEGMQADLEKKRYATFEELEWYLYRVAVIVGQATLDILGVKGPQADALALSLGQAAQLTNIVRDVYDDARLGRVYLPCTLTAQEILAGTHADQVQQLLRQTAARAQERYALAFKQMQSFWPTQILPCRVMGYTYQKNLAKIERADFTFTKTVKLTRFEKIQMVLYALIKTLF